MHDEFNPGTTSTARLAYVAIGLFLVLTPLALQKPGIPGGLKADEAAYLMMATSLGHDFDLEVTAEDTQRLFDEFPLRWTSNLIVFSNDGWQTVHYGKPYVYSLIVAPFARAFGSNGLLSANLLMLWLMVGLGWRVLAAHNPSSLALLFSAAFFGWSACSSYAFWLQPEVFNMFFVTLALYLGFAWKPVGAPSGPALFLAGCALALPVYNKPMLLALALPMALPALFDKGRAGERLRPAASLTAGLAIVGGLALVGSLLLTGHPSAYGVAGRQGVRICEPGEVPRPPGWQANQQTDPDSATDPADPAQAAVADPPGGGSARAEPDSAAAADAENRSFYWLLRIPEFEPSRWIENFGYFLWGRHTGLLIYFPWALLAIVLFLGRKPRDLARWILLASVGAIALYFLLYIGWNWQGGGGFVGNRYFVNAVPALLFLVRSVRPSWALLVTSAWTGLIIGPLLLTPFGITVPEPTLQAHTRNWPLRHFPLELTLKNVPGYDTTNQGGLRIIARADQVVRRGGEFVVAARADPRILLVARQPLQPITVQVTGLAPATSVRVSLGGAEETVELAQGETRTLELEPRRARQRHTVTGPRAWVYQLRVQSDRGAMFHWTRQYPPWPCDSFRFDRQVSESFYAGAIVRFLGETAELQRDIYQVGWEGAVLPEIIRPGERFMVPVTLVNRSQFPWLESGAAKINLSSHWLDLAGNAVEFDGLRTAVPALEPGATATLRLEVQAPETPGSYLLEFDLVREYVSWFAERNGGNTYRTQVELAPADLVVQRPREP